MGNEVSLECNPLNSLGPNGIKDPEEYVKFIENYIEEGGDINIFINPEDCEYLAGIPILHQAIRIECKEIVSYMLDNEADITIEAWIYRWGNDFNERPWNALEMAILMYSDSETYGCEEIFQMIKDKALEECASYGMHPFHIECALGDRDKLEEYLEDPSNVNRAIDLKSPIWPGMTSLLIAAKFNRRDVVTRLLNVGASPKVRDSKRNTPLHYLIHTREDNSFCDERLFIFEEEDTYGEFNGMTHFHIACFSRSVKVVKKYLEQGVSPNYPVKNENANLCEYRVFCDGTTGFHMVGEWLFKCRPCPDLARLLIEYGADIHQRDNKGKTALQRCTYTVYVVHDNNDRSIVEHMCVLLEAGSKASFENDMKCLIHWLQDKPIERVIFLKCLKQMIILNEDLVAENLKNYHEYYKSMVHATPEFDENSFSELCRKELNELESLKLRRELEDVAEVKSDFKEKFGSLIGSSEVFKLYPIYGQQLVVKLKRRLNIFEKKLKKIEKAVPYITFFAKNQKCVLPVSCSEEILWNFSIHQLETFSNMFSKINIRNEE